MVEINVAKPFTLLHRNGDRQHFAAGAHAVDEATANHWYVQEHLASENEAGAAEDDEPSGDGDDKAALLSKAKALGLAVDGRWTVEKIAAAIAEAQAGKD